MDNSTSVEMPKHLIKLLYSANIISGGARQTKTDVLASLVYVLGIECGFVTVSHSNLNYTNYIAKSWASFDCMFAKQFCDQLPKFYRCESINGYETQLILYQLSHKIILFIAREIGDGLCITVNVTLSNGENFCRSLYLSTGRYVLKTQLKHESLSAKCFQNFNELSLRVKDVIFMPVRMALLADELVSYEYRGVFSGLLGLPNELLIKIYRMLAFEEKKHFGQSCVVLFKLFSSLNDQQSPKDKTAS